MAGGFPPIKFCKKKTEKKKNESNARHYETNIKNNINIRQILNTKKKTVIEKSIESDELEIV